MRSTPADANAGQTEKMPRLCLPWFEDAETGQLRARTEEEQADGCTPLLPSAVEEAYSSKVCEGASDASSAEYAVRACRA